MERMNKYDADTARRMFTNGKSFKYIIDQFQEYKPLSVLHELSFLMIRFPEKKEERMVIAGAYIIDEIEKNGWTTYKEIEDSLGIARATAKRYMIKADKAGVAKAPKNFVRDYKLEQMTARELKESIWNDYMGYKHNKWNEKNIMTMEQLMDKYHLSKYMITKYVNEWSEVMMAQGKKKGK